MNKTFRKACAKLHLWLGLLSGIVVFIVCITGCMYAFKDEITDATQPWRFVAPLEKEFLPPSRLLAIADSVMGGASATAITYGERSDAAWVDYYQPEAGMSTVFINPYSGQVLKSVGIITVISISSGWCLAGIALYGSPGRSGVRLLVTVY